jgi:hypothetical protein
MPAPHCTNCGAASAPVKKLLGVAPRFQVTPKSSLVAMAPAKFCWLPDAPAE